MNKKQKLKEDVGLFEYLGELIQLCRNMYKNEKRKQSQE